MCSAVGSRSDSVDRNSGESRDLLYRFQMTPIRQSEGNEACAESTRYGLKIDVFIFDYSIYIIAGRSTQKPSPKIIVF